MSILSDDEIMLAQKLISSMPSGIYVLQKIFGIKWINITSPTDYGHRFKNTVKNKLLNHIEIGVKKSNNHQTYIVNKT